MGLQLLFEKLLFQVAAACGARKFVLKWVNNLVSDLKSTPHRSLDKLSSGHALDLTRRGAKFSFLLAVSAVFVTAYKILVGPLDLDTIGEIGLGIPFIGAPAALFLLLLFEKGVKVRAGAVSFRSLLGSGSEIRLSDVRRLVFEIRSSTEQKVPVPEVAVRLVGPDRELVVTGADRKALVSLASLFPPEDRTVNNELGRDDAEQSGST